MTKKPFSRAFDVCWYAQTRVGTPRKQVKLLDEHRDPIRGPENEAAAWKAFHRHMAADPTTLPEPSALKVSHVCDLFLSAICPYAGDPPTKPPKTADPPLPLKTNASHDVRTYWCYRKYLQSFCDLCGTLSALAIKPFHVTRWLDLHPKWTTSRRCAVICAKRAYNWAEGGAADSQPDEAGEEARRRPPRTHLDRGGAGPRRRGHRAPGVPRLRLRPSGDRLSAGRGPHSDRRERQPDARP